MQVEFGVDEPSKVPEIKLVADNEQEAALLCALGFLEAMSLGYDLDSKSVTVQFREIETN